MSSCITWHSAYMVAIIFCAMLEPSQSHGCATEKTENATVDLKVALARGIRGADPVHVTSWEACINLCCFGRSILDNRKCSLIVFKPQRRGNSPNCYLFHCPTEEACPVKQAVGLVTYRMIRDAEVLKPTSSINTSLDLIVSGSFVSPKAVVLNTSGPTTPPSQKALTPKMKILMGQVEKPVEKIHQHSHRPEGEGTNTSRSSDSLPTHQTIHSLTPTNSPQNLVPNILSTVKLTAVTPSSETVSVSGVPPSNASSTGRATADYGNTHVVTVSPRQSGHAPQPTVTSQAKASSLSPLPPSLSMKISSAALHEAYLSHGQLSRDSDNGAPGEKYTFYLADKSVLLAALLFGVIFLLLAQVMIGRKLLESLRHRRYSRLDYLINGMYANV